MSGGEVCFTPANPEPLASVPPPNQSVPDQQACVMPDPPQPPAPPPKEAYSALPKPVAKPLMSFVSDEANTCEAPPPPKVDDTKPKLEKLDRLGSIYADTVNNWAENHRVAKKDDGWAMHAMDWVFARKANARYEAQEKELKALYGNFKAKIASGDLDGAKAAYNALMDKIKAFGGEAHRLNNQAIENAESAKKGAEYVAAGSAVVFVAAGTVVAAPVIAGGGAVAAKGAAALGLGAKGAAVFSFGGQVIAGGMAVGAMNGTRMAVTNGIAATGAALAFGDRGAKDIGKDMLKGYGDGYKDGFIGGAGGVVAGKLIQGLGAGGARLAQGGGRLATVGKGLEHGSHWVHHGIEHLGKEGAHWYGAKALVKWGFWKQFAPLAVEQGVKYGIVKPGGAAGYVYVTGGDGSKAPAAPKK